MSIEKSGNKGMALITRIKQAIKRLDQFSPYPIFYPFRMSKNEIAVFDKSIKGSKHYLEFGLGGSSLRAIQKSKAIIYTVESSPEWIDYMRKYFAIRFFEKKRLNIFPVNIGPTGDWGFPESDNSTGLFEAYSSSIYKSIDKKSVDLALIDGRFRVACVLKLIIECHENPKLRMLIHDFWDREQYQSVLKYLDVISRADTIGLFSIKKNIDLDAVRADYEAYKLNPA